MRHIVDGMKLGMAIGLGVVVALLAMGWFNRWSELSEWEL